MRITTNTGLSVECATEQDVIDVCHVLNTEPWSEAEIAECEAMLQAGVPMIEAMRRVDAARERKVS